MCLQSRVCIAHRHQTSILNSAAARCPPYVSYRTVVHQFLRRAADQRPCGAGKTTCRHHATHRETVPSAQPTVGESVKSRAGLTAVRTRQSCKAVECGSSTGPSGAQKSSFLRCRSGGPLGEGAKLARHGHARWVERSLVSSCRAVGCDSSVHPRKKNKSRRRRVNLAAWHE